MEIMSDTEEKTTYDIFVTKQEHELKIKELRSVFIEHDMDRPRTKREAIQAGFSGFKDDTVRLFNAVKKRIRIRKKGKNTEVKSIHIVPDTDGDTWARRSASSAASRSSADSELSVDTYSSRRGSDVKIVHDMDSYSSTL